MFKKFENKLLHTAKNEQGLMFYIDLMSSVQSSQHSLKFFRRELEKKAHENDEFGVAQSLAAIGCYHFCAGEYRKSIDYHIRSRDIFKKLGDIDGVIISLIGISQGYNFLSDYQQVDAINETLLAIIEKSGDSFARALVMLNSAEYDIMKGNHKSAEEYYQKVYDMTYQDKLWYPHCLSNILLGYINIEKLEVKKSLEYLEKARELIELYKYNVQFTLYVYYILPEAYCIDYMLTENDLSTAQKIKYLRKIKASCRDALRKTKKWSTHYGGALRAKAKYYHLVGNNKKAEKLFLMSIDHCSRLGRRYELGVSFFFYSIFLNQIGREKDFLVRLKAAHRLFREIDSRLYLARTSTMLGLQYEEVSSEKISKKQMISSVISESQEIISIQDFDELLVTILMKACELTGAMRGCLFVGNSKDTLEELSMHNMSSREIRKYIKSIAYEAYDRGTVIISKTEIIEKLNILKNLEIDSKTRSVLCMPIKLGNRNIGVCYLDNSLTELFTEDDSGILSLFMSHVAAVIENAVLNKKLESQNKKVKQHITPRTEEKLKKAISYIEENYSFDISREGLAASLDMNPDSFGRYFKIYTKKKINEYINALRIEEAARKLRETDEPVIDIAFSVGFNSLPTFNRTFLKTMKTTPGRYRSKHR